MTEIKEVKSCCGSKSYILIPDKAVLKKHLKAFQDRGYSTSQHYTDSGIFYVQKERLTVTGPFGIRRLQAKCSKKKLEKLDEFVKLLDSIVGSDGNEGGKES